MKTIRHDGYRELLTELRSAREMAGTTQAEAGRLIGHSRQWVSKIELSEIRLDVLQLAQLCQLYGLKAHELVRRMEEGVP